MGGVGDDSNGIRHGSLAGDTRCTIASPRGNEHGQGVRHREAVGYAVAGQGGVQHQLPAPICNDGVDHSFGTAHFCVGLRETECPCGADVDHTPDLWWMRS